MEIKIDTEKDSKETIKKVIDLLKTLVDESNISSYNPDAYDSYSKNFNDSAQNNDDGSNRADSYTPPSDGLFSIFDSNNDSSDENKSDVDDSYNYSDKEDEDDKKNNDLDLDLRRKKEKEDSEERVNIIPY